MSRCIVIENCKDCVYKDHAGAFGRVAYVPRCNKVIRELPHTLHADKRIGVVALVKPGIPDWCPLPELK